MNQKELKAAAALLVGPALKGPVPEREPTHPYIREDELRANLGISSTTLERWIAEQGFPIPKRLSPRVKIWSRAAVNAWIEAQPDDCIGKNLPKRPVGRPRKIIPAGQGAAA